MPTAPIPCPFCSRPITLPSVEAAIFQYEVSPFQARILRRLWAAHGLPVGSQRLFDAMYADDPDGGPEEFKMYAALKEAVHRLRAKLTGSGIHVLNCGYRKGYRLMIEAPE